MYLLYGNKFENINKINNLDSVLKQKCCLEKKFYPCEKNLLQLGKKWLMEKKKTHWEKKTQLSYLTRVSHPCCTY